MGDMVVNSVTGSSSVETAPPPVIVIQPTRGLAALFNPTLYPGIGPALPISQEELGQLAGLSRQRVNQALKRLEQARLLRVEYGGVTVLSLDGLRTFEG